MVYIKQLIKSKNVVQARQEKKLHLIRISDEKDDLTCRQRKITQPTTFTNKVQST